MKIKKLFYIGIGIIALFTLALIIYAKSKIPKLDYNMYIENSPYSFISSIHSSVNDLEGMDYESMFKLQDFFIDEQITSFEDLKELSDYILLVANNEAPTFRGNGIINNCTILKVIKGNELKQNEKIKIYDLVFHWDIIRTFYLGGNTPLQMNNEYIVFLRKPERASIKDAYVFSSVKYGRVSILNERGVLEDYEQGSSKVKEILNYDFVFSKNNDEEVLKYKEFVKEIRNYANKVK